MSDAAFAIDVSAAGVMDSTPSGRDALDYDALEPKGRRKSPRTTVAREDVYLLGGKRTKLQANASDIVRNFAIAAWAVRRHLDYVARMDFRALTKDEGLNNAIEELVEIQSRPTNFDRGGRAPREKFFRMAEARRVIDGDTGILMLADGSVQGIESDLIRNPQSLEKSESHEWVDGVEIDGAGYPRRYSVYGRGKGGQSYTWRRNVQAASFILYGFFDRYASEQVRGVSPIVTALNPLRDVYENFDLALMRSKIAQLFALAIYRDPQTAQAIDADFRPAQDDDADDCTEDKPRPREIDLSNGPTLLDLDAGEKAEFLESKSPSSELQNFSRLVVMVALKALDIPYSFFDEGHTNYSGQRTSWLMYERSCLDRRDDQIEMRRRWTIFQLRRLILSGELKLPRSMTIADLYWEWVPLGMPWWKPSEEITGDLKAIAAGLTSPQRVCKERGLGDCKDNLRETAEFMRFARDLGQELLDEPIRLNFDPGPFASAIVTDQANQ
jgi:capsid protein